MAELPQNIPPMKIQVWATIREAFEFLFKNWGLLWRWIFLGTLLNGLSRLFFGFVVFKNPEAIQDYFVILGEIILGILITLPWISMFIFLTIVCHRLILLGPINQAYHEKFHFSKREKEYFWYMLRVYLRLILIVLPGFLLFVVVIFLWDDHNRFFQDQNWVVEFFLYLILGIPFLYFLGRYSLVFPAIAVDFKPIQEWAWPKSVHWSSAQAKGNEWRLVLLAGGVPLSLGLSNIGISILSLNQWVLVDSFVSSFFHFASLPIEVAALAIAFRELTNWTSLPAD